MPDDGEKQQEQAQQDEAPQETSTQQEAPETGAESGAKAPEEFKSDESKQALLADLKKLRDENKTFKDAEAQREREKLSDIERAQAERDDYRTKWEAAETARIRSEVARAKGVDPELLTGTTEDEMTAHAERLIAWRGGKPVPPPNPNPAQGVEGSHEPDDDLFNKALGRGQR